MRDAVWMLRFWLRLTMSRGSTFLREKTPGSALPSSETYAFNLPGKNTPNEPEIGRPSVLQQAERARLTPPAGLTAVKPLPARVGRHMVSKAYDSLGARRTIGLFTSASM